MSDKKFEDITYELLSRVSPVKLDRRNIPFDTIREIVLNEMCPGNMNKKKNGRLTLGAGVTIEQSTASKFPSPTYTNGSIIGEEDDSLMSAPMSTDCFLESEEDSRMSDEVSSNRSFGNRRDSWPVSQVQSRRSLPSSYKERRLAEARDARVKQYRNVQPPEYNCDERELRSYFELAYTKMMDESSCAAGIYFAIVTSLETYYRPKTWDSNLLKVITEFINDSVYRTCEDLNELHETRDVHDELRVKEMMIQTLLGLFLYKSRKQQSLLDDVSNKLRIVYMVSEPKRMRNFLEEQVTDIFVTSIPEALASIFEELCVILPPDLMQYDTGFKMEDTFVVKKKNGKAAALESLLAEANGEDTAKSRGRRVAIKQEPLDMVEQAVQQTPTKPQRRRIERDAKRVVQETPDEKLRSIKQEPIDEEVKQTPMAKLRSQSRKGASKRLSEMVKISEERASIPRAAALRAEKLAESSKSSSTPGRRSSTRPINKRVLFGVKPASNGATSPTPSTSPAPSTSTSSSGPSLRARANLSSRFQACSASTSTSRGTARRAPRKNYCEDRPRSPEEVKPLVRVQKRGAISPAKRNHKRFKRGSPENLRDRLANLGDGFRKSASQIEKEILDETGLTMPEWRQKVGITDAKVAEMNELFARVERKNEEVARRIAAGEHRERAERAVSPLFAGVTEVRCKFRPRLNRKREGPLHNTHLLLESNNPDLTKPFVLPEVNEKKVHVIPKLMFSSRKDGIYTATRKSLPTLDEAEASCSKVKVEYDEDYPFEYEADD